MSADRTCRACINHPVHGPIDVLIVLPPDDAPAGGTLTGMELAIGVVLTVLAAIALFGKVHVETWFAVVVLICGLILVLLHLGVVARFRRTD